MRYLIISGSSNPDPLCQSIIQEVEKGAIDGGAETTILSIDGIGRCKNCNNDWGMCKNIHTCEFSRDGFGQAHEMVIDADALCFVLGCESRGDSDALLGLLERLRRCEMGQFGALSYKPVLIVTFPETAENNLLSRLELFDRFCRQTGAMIFDFLGVYSWNSDYMKVSAYSAGRAMAFGRKAKAH